jgi:phage-related protein
MTLPILYLTPTWQTSQKTLIPTTKTRLGDNYSQVLTQGIFPIVEWDVRSPVYSESEVNDILSVLRQYADKSFLWSPTGQNLKECVCGEWVLSLIGENQYIISNKITASQVRSNIPSNLGIVM